ncbi:hypothetical protein V9T40_000191 [Parthenolecanium corni]|uniref:Uncharacterized protein n=1 Tax=Parthenolecanium corni TaxID=536013 RepID=A0AAN9TLY4_9HEMI
MEGRTGTRRTFRAGRRRRRRRRRGNAEKKGSAAVDCDHLRRKMKIDGRGGHLSGFGNGRARTDNRHRIVGRAYGPRKQTAPQQQQLRYDFTAACPVSYTMCRLQSAVGRPSYGYSPMPYSYSLSPPRLHRREDKIKFKIATPAVDRSRAERRANANGWAERDEQKTRHSTLQTADCRLKIGTRLGRGLPSSRRSREKKQIVDE